MSLTRKTKNTIHIEMRWYKKYDALRNNFRIILHDE